KMQWKKKWWVLAGIPLMSVLLLLLIPNPVGDRFRDLSGKRIQLVFSDDIGEEEYLDGLSLRLLQLRFAGEILSEELNWLTGVGPDRSQKELDARYASVHLYGSSANGEKTGYYGYNFHNQFAETWVQGGLLPLLTLVIMLCQGLMEGIRRKNMGLFWVSLIFSAFCFTESVFERQLGVIS